ncbi:unnamed protein product [Closterium sp. NIES-53]
MAEEKSAPPKEEERGRAQEGANVQGEALPQGEARAQGEPVGKGEAGGAELMDTSAAPKQGLSFLLSSAELISQGAEARVFAATFCGRPAILKQRFEKKYRHPTLDARLTSKRLHTVSTPVPRPPIHSLSSPCHSEQVPPPHAGRATYRQAPARGELSPAVTSPLL